MIYVFTFVIAYAVFSLKKTIPSYQGQNPDRFTEERTNTLHPSVRQEVREILWVIYHRYGLHVRITIDGHFRTFDEQGVLRYKYEKGGPLAAKPGESYHNYGFAVDVVAISNDGTRALWDDFSVYLKIANVFKEYGWQWGYDLWNKDLPHFQKPSGYSISYLLSWKEQNPHEKYV